MQCTSWLLVHVTNRPLVHARHDKAKKTFPLQKEEIGGHLPQIPHAGRLHH